MVFGVLGKFRGTGPQSRNFSKIVKLYYLDLWSFQPKTAGEGGQFDRPHCGFSKNVSSKERVKLWFFMTFDIIIGHIFPENLIEIPQVG